jgi:rRNA maturation endonuclease Nob1
MSKAKTERSTRPITVCIRCLVAYTDHDSGECDDCLSESYLEADLAMARALINKQNEVRKNEN